MWVDSIEKYHLGSTKCHDHDILTLGQPIKLQHFEQGNANILSNISTATDERISRAELRLTDIADVLQGDWVILARQLNISEEEIAKIQTDYTYVSEQALVMLHLWVTKFGPNATGGKSELIVYFEQNLLCPPHTHTHT